MVLSPTDQDGYRMLTLNCWACGAELWEVLKCTDDPAWRTFITNEYVMLDMKLKQRGRKFVNGPEIKYFPRG